MPLTYTTKSATLPNLCMECGESCRRPKRFCSDAHEKLFLSGPGFVIDPRGKAQVEADRKRLGITATALEWRRKRNVQLAF
jgi:hypothetical protein